jgi:hypothetical protein
MEKNSQAVIPDNIIVVEGDGLNPVPTPEAGDAGKVLGVLNSSGDIGWVEDQGGTLTQVQSDWAETDSSKVSYIDNKPDLSVYATTSAVNTALAGKQDTISDLSEIRAGAAKGDTAVQPSALDAYATTSAMNTALAGKQDTISDLATIRSGAAAGATAVQPSALESYATTSAMNTALAGKQDTISDLSDIRSGAALGATAVQQADMPSSDELVPSASSGDAGKVLTVDAQGEPQWVTPSGGTTYSAGDGVDIDANNVISADVDGVTIGIDSTTKKIKSLQTIPSVDQTYNASSTNAQSGTAVAQAIAAIPSSSYTAGDGIDITANEVSVKVGTGLEIGNATKEFEGSQTIQRIGSEGSYSYYMHYLQLNADLVDAIENGGLTVTLDPNFECTSSVFPVITDAGYALYNSGIFFGATSATVSPGAVLNISLADRNETYSALDFNTVKSNPTSYYLAFASADQYSKYVLQGKTPSSVTSITTEYSFNTTIQNAVNVKNPLPASAQADSGKVLKVNASGNAEWGTDGFMTTAGITDIQQVAALPANPVATVLYLIPET